MPIYEFRCESCGYEFERLQKISEPDPERCPECGEPGVSRLISAAAFRLKGGGWYETDFKQGNRRNVIGGHGSGEGAKGTGKAESQAKGEKTESAPKSSGGGSNSGGEAAA